MKLEAGRSTPRTAPVAAMSNKYDVATWTEPRSFTMRYGRSWFAIPACLWILMAPPMFAALIWGSMPKTFWPGGLVLVLMAAGLSLGSHLLAATLGRWRGGTITIAPARRELIWRRPHATEPTRTWSFEEIEAVKAATFSLTDVTMRVPGRRLRFTTNASGAPEPLARSLERAAGLTGTPEG